MHHSAEDTAVLQVMMIGGGKGPKQNRAFPGHAHSNFAAPHTAYWYKINAIRFS